MVQPTEFEPCYNCHEGPGRFIVFTGKKKYYLCGGCFMRREDHLRIAGKDLLTNPDDSHRAPGSNA